MIKIVKIINSVILLSFCIGCFTYTINPMSKHDMKLQMQSKTFIASNGISFVYREYCPCITRKLPIVFYLHGAGQRGNDNDAQLDVGTGSLMSIASEKDEYSSVVISPQCPLDHLWRDDVMLEALAEFISQKTQMSFIDKNRICITGYSMGGDATWKLAVKYPNIFTTAIPVCGGPLETMEPDRPQVNEATANLNIWAFNNLDDSIVRSNYSKYMFSKIWNYNINDKLNFTENIEGGHDPTAIYRNRKYMIWMLSVK